MISFLWLSGLITIYLTWKVVNWFFKFKDVSKIPGPPVRSILGNIDVFGSNSAETFRNQLELVNKYGPFCRIWLGTKLMILLADPDKIEIILKSNVNIQKSKGYDGFKIWLGNGLINSTGDFWRRHRKILTPTFHFSILNQFTQFMNSNSKILVSKLKEHVGEKSLDMYKFLTDYNLDVISEAAMRTKINAQNDPKSAYCEALHGFLEIHISKFFSLYKQIECLFRFTKDYQTQVSYAKTMKELTSDIIKSRKEERTQTKIKVDENEYGIKNTKAFLDLLLDMEDVLTEEEIREEVDTFMFGGHHTLSSAASFCLLELSNHPDIQKKLVQESIEILGEDESVELTMQNINKMKYLDMVIKESLRFYAPVPFVEREIQTDIEIDGLKIPAGTTITILIYALHRSEKYFPEPDKFDPDRFLPENIQGRHPFAYIPFSAGPRNCIGMRYATLSVKAQVIQILRNFEILPVEKFQPILSNSAILVSENGIQMQLKLRK